jgi:hypothetical protein
MQELTRKRSLASLSIIHFIFLYHAQKSDASNDVHEELKARLFILRQLLFISQCYITHQFEQRDHLEAARVREEILGPVLWEVAWKWWRMKRMRR